MIEKHKFTPGRSPEFCNICGAPARHRRHEEPAKTSVQIRRALLSELAGYFRTANETPEEGIGNAIEKAMMIGIAFGHGGAAAAGQTVGLLGVPLRYAKAIIDTLEGR